MDCPLCGERDLDRDSVDVGVGVIHGPYGCQCGWSEDPKYNKHSSDCEPFTDVWGRFYPAAKP